MPESPSMSTPFGDMVGLWSEHGKLLIQRCEDCGEHFFFPRTRCPHCWSHDLAAVPSDGAGHVRSFSLVYKGLPDDLQAQAPIIIAEIKLDQGATLIARIVATIEEIQIGTRVVLLEAEAGKAFQLPTFKAL